MTRTRPATVAWATSSRSNGSRVQVTCTAALQTAEAVTSAVRYERDGWLGRPLRNLGCLSLYFLGMSPRTLQRLYGR